MSLTISSTGFRPPGSERHRTPGRTILDARTRPEVGRLRGSRSGVGERGREPVPGPDADGVVAWLAHRVLVLRDRLADDRGVHRVARAPARQPGPARPRAH